LPEVLRPGIQEEKIIHLLVRENERIVAAGVGLEWRERFLKLFRGGWHIRLATTPARKDVDRNALYIALLEHCRYAGYGSLAIGAGYGEDVTEMEPWNRHVKASYLEFTVNLRQSLDEIRAAMHKKHRKNLNTAMEAGIGIEEAMDQRTFLRLRDMQESSSVRAAERGNRYGIQEERFYKELFECVYSNGPGHVLFAVKDGEYLAALAYLKFGRKALTVRSGATTKGYEFAAMYLLQFELFRQLKEEGIEEVNIGGVPARAAEPSHPNHGLYNFKRYFGGDSCLRHEVEIPL
jgi:hypothetical protein